MTFGALVIFSLAACKKDEKSTLPTEQLNNNTVETVLNSQPLVESGTFQGLVRLRLSGLTNRRDK
ncbi:hypothetical protein ACQ86K_22565 [Mucilaginibacter sp. P19]|uniref:hypothetical protein n=1 Tax=Mucilaginibacter sp. P19 TaxID=3423947 RepID=UPI003D66D944